MFRHLSKHRQLFINNRNVEVGRVESRYGCHNVKRVLHQPTRQKLVVEPDRPWESPTLQMLSNNVIYDAQRKRFRLWYSCFRRQWYDACDMEVESCCLLYAESVDGVEWTKPDLGLYEAQGSKHNNICLSPPGQGIMWAGVMEDPHDRPERRFKLLGHGSTGKDHGVAVYFSPDGIHWTPGDSNPVLYARVDCGDSHTLMGCRDPRTGRFVAALRPQDWWLSYPDIPYYRYDRGDPQDVTRNGLCPYRSVGISFSDDFTSWPPPREVLRADLNDAPGTQMQGMTVCPYQDIYLGFLMMHYADGADDTIDIQLAASDDLLQWQRVGQGTPFMPLGDEGPWRSRMIFAVSATPIVRGEKLYIYYNPHRTTHYTSKPVHMDDDIYDRYFPASDEPDELHRHAAVGLATLRLDGFVSMHVDGEGFLVTKPFTFDGNELRVNADIAGELRVQVLDEAFMPREDYLSRPATGDHVDHLITFENSRQLGHLAGQPVRLRFLMRDTHLYSFWIK